MSNVKLRDFLSEGSIIRTRHCNSSNWVTNVVFAINEDWIEIDIGLEKNYIDNMIMIGDTMRCKYSNDDYEFTLIGWVTKIKLDEPQSITIKVHDVEKFLNRRDNYRYDIFLCSVIKRTKNDEKGVFAIMTNLSQGGAAFVGKEDVENELGVPESDQGEKNFYFEIFINPKKQLCLPVL